MTIPFTTSITLAGNEAAKKLICDKKDSAISIFESFSCGAFAGLISFPVDCPVDLVKKKLQLQVSENSQAYYKSTIDCVRKTIKFGGVKSLFKGGVSMMLWELVGYSAYFGIYQSMKLFIAEKASIPYDNLSSAYIFLAGALAGLISLQLTYPISTINALIQTESNFKQTAISQTESLRYYEMKMCPGKKEPICIYHQQFKDGGLISCAKYIHKVHGISGFYMGAIPSSVSIFYMSGFMFISFEGLMGLFNSHL